MSLNQPKILIFTVASWNSKVGANTWATLLENYDRENLANIYIRNEIPDSQVCSKYFSISENKVLKSIFNRKIKTGNLVSAQFLAIENNEDLLTHNKRYVKMTKKRRYSMLLLREFCWKIGKWKTKELDEFLDDFKPDIILHSMEGYIHLNRIIEYAVQRTRAKVVGYIWDDNFTYKQSSKLGYKIYRLLQRKSLKSLGRKTDAFFAITPKTKEEADAYFGIDCVVLSKPLNAIPHETIYESPSYPLKFLYTGNLLIGRDKSLKKIVLALNKIPNVYEKVKIDIYTQTVLSSEQKEELETSFCTLHPPIKQEEVIRKQKDADVLLFLEDLSEENLAARLSFSTKITDYLSAGRCIFAVGNRDLAPMEYFESNQAALVSYTGEEIEHNLHQIFSDLDILSRYAHNAVVCGLKNHTPEMILKTFDEVIMKVYRGRNEDITD